MIEERDCIYPDCLIEGDDWGPSCEHACPFERGRATEAVRALKEQIDK